MEEATAMNEQEEFEFRMRAEREAAMPQATPDPGIGNVMLNAVPKGVANLVNTPVTLWNLAKQAAGAIHPQIKDYMQPTPNYPMQAAESLGLVDPAKEPQTAGQRIADAAVQGGVGALAGPGGFIKNAATGMAAGGVGQTTTEVTGSPLAGMAAGALTPFALRSYSKPPSMSPVKQQTFEEGRKAGYVVPPTEVHPSFFNEKLESMAGKAAVKQEAVLRNQGVTNALAAKALGLAPDTPLTESSLQAVRDQASQPYKAVAQMSPMGKTALEKLQETRFEASDAWKFYQRSGDPAARKEATALSQRAEMYEKAIEKMANQAGQPDLVNQLRESRKLIAKTYDVEKSLNLGSADVSAASLGAQLDKAGTAAKTGELAVTGKFQQAFPKFMGDGTKSPVPGVSGTDMPMAAGLGLGGYGALGPAGMFAAGLPLLRGPARAFALSNMKQNRLIPQASEALGDTATRSALIADILAARQQQGVQ
jgi:hypothetical protein